MSIYIWEEPERVKKNNDFFGVLIIIMLRIHLKPRKPVEHIIAKPAATLHQQGFVPLIIGLPVDQTKEIFVSPNPDPFAENPAIIWVDPKQVLAEETFVYPEKELHPPNIAGAAISLYEYRKSGNPGFVTPMIKLVGIRQDEVSPLALSDIEQLFELEEWESRLQQIARGRCQTLTASFHPWTHTLRVVERASQLAQQVCPQHLRAVKIAAYLHDLGRASDLDDPAYALKGEALAKEIIEQFDFLTIKERQSILFAIAHHADQTPTFEKTFPVTRNYNEIQEAGLIEGVVAVLWDADRLDLPRVRPVSRQFLSTTQAQALVDHANRKWLAPFPTHPFSPIPVTTISRERPPLAVFPRPEKLRQVTEDDVLLYPSTQDALLTLIRLAKALTKGKSWPDKIPKGGRWIQSALSLSSWEKWIANAPADFLPFYFTGTSSGSLIGLAEAKALLPMGSMLEQPEPRIVPFCGELGLGINQQNGLSNYAISFTKDARRALDEYAGSRFNLVGWDPYASGYNIAKLNRSLSQDFSSAQAAYNSAIEMGIKIEEKRLLAWKTLSDQEKDFVATPFPMVLGAVEVESQNNFQILGEVKMKPEWIFHGPFGIINRPNGRLVLYCPAKKVTLTQKYLTAKDLPALSVQPLEALETVLLHAEIKTELRNLSYEVSEKAEIIQKPKRKSLLPLFVKQWLLNRARRKFNQ